MNLSNEIKTGLLFIFGIILFIIGFSYLKSNDVFSADRKFFGIYDNTEGVVPGTPVTINGFQVGSVESIELLNPSAKILVTFRIENKFNFSRNSTAQIYESGLIGGKLLGIIPANDNAVNAKKGDTLKTSVAPGLTDLVNEKLSPLQEKIESMIVHADSLLISFNNILDYDRIDKIKSSIDNVNIILNNLNSITLTIDEAINSKNGKINKSLESFSLASENIKNITDTLISVPLKNTFEALESASINISKISDEIIKGNGSVNRLIYGDTLINNLNKTNDEIQLLMEDLRKNPKKYVHFSLFGKK